MKITLIYVIIWVQITEQDWSDFCMSINTFDVHSSKNKYVVEFDTPSHVQIVDVKCDFEGLDEDNRVRVSYQLVGNLNSKVQVGDETGLVYYRVKLIAYHSFKNIELDKPIGLDNPRIDKFEYALGANTFEDIDSGELVSGAEDVLVNDALSDIYDNNEMTMVIREVK